jgi:hypothetical protein
MQSFAAWQRDQCARPMPVQRQASPAVTAAEKQADANMANRMFTTEAPCCSATCL